ncbi:DUF4388 domain-containing protein [Desulfuromonas acetoxidans]|uniref:DUF4388 domain-containing protein n=1 Tax=Desulfuromonas acetoxidans TaxID=891 RepID=UPI0015939ED7|nr:DUF4388 domain-containing protein [Desulfuromonas acetoxidans]MBF0646945.1 DUF4388 domain-containing protein [Desulfuromonas acetoxidans]NVE17771.1 DUF4388 domain-containing protein [Desulfuromonas acetoxidans]
MTGNTAEELGFTGELPTVGLADLLQMQNQNGFSGALSIQQGEHKGAIYFHQGDVVHAEYGRWRGLKAVYIMLGRGKGRFSCQMGLEPPRQTIDVTMNHLLLEGHRWLDELTDKQREALFYDAPQERKVNRLVKKLLPIQGVEYAVLFDENGQPHEDETNAGLRMSAQGDLMRNNGVELGRILGLGELRSGMFSGRGGHMLLLISNLKALLVSISGKKKPQSVEAAVRKTLMDH